jgi:hypothetical protein
MKQLFSIIAICITLSATAQSNVVSNASVIPTAVTDAFVKKFPNATDVQWDTKTTKTSADIAIYHVSFDIGMTEKENDAWIDKDGNIIRHKKEINAATLPETIQLSIKKNFPGFTIGDVDRMEDNGVISYIFGVKNGSRERKVMMDDNGNIKANMQD